MKKLSTLFNNVAKQAGFTMIELLVVIAVIGVLAVAVLSSINPIEQINKGRDTRTRSDAAQLINAVDRYYAIQEIYPWNFTTTDFTAVSVLPADEFDFLGAGSNLLTQGLTTGDETDWDWVDVLVNTSEVKEGFTNRLKNDNSLFVAKEQGSNATMYICFYPSSNAFKQEAMRNCADGTTPSSLNTIVICEDETDIEALNLICLP
ncbi:type II secretion system GspH family protein [Patescibacteria group bacterium]|nr:type II secretion system GspH family protein [Patescibacteria group bacterium]MBU1967198.1 type II secretion system GspH family protein [Patescibacteria group bacterium]MBU2543010.1 type II secretion system GspH family protein [Patescibacteria group bacterium]